MAMRLQVAKRVFEFLTVFTLLPTVASALCAVFLRGGGIRGASTSSLGVLAWKTDPGFIALELGKCLMGSALISVMLAVVSLFAWQHAQGYSALRTARLGVLVWLVAVILYPSVAGWFPVLRGAPWIVTVCAFLIVLLVAYAWPRARAGKGELLLSLAVVLLLFYNPPRSSPNLEQLAHRAFTEKDVFIIGFDSVARVETFELLERFQPKHGSKTLYTNAQTPFPATSVAWRSIFSGHYPPSEAELPNLRWGSGGGSWLPSELRKVGMNVVFAQDLQETNAYAPDEDVRVLGPQGWKAVLQGFLWKACFPLSSVGAEWWVGMLGGPARVYGRPAHCTQCFIGESLRDVALVAANGPVLGAIHTCLVHGPNQLKLREALRIAGWWRLPGAFFMGRTERGAGERARSARMQTVRVVMRETLEMLEREGVLGKATVFLIADHGPRGEDVPPTMTNNVMFALFTASGNATNTVTTPVSLVDIAPTIRQLLTLPESDTDGHVLPRSDGEGDPGRIVKTTIMRRPGILTLMGLESRALSAQDMSKFGQLSKDGTFDYSREIVAKARELSRVSRQP